MSYLCSLTVDTLNLNQDGKRQAAYEQLKNALIQLGWSYVETTSFVVQTTDVSVVYNAMVLVAKAQADIGGFSHVSFQLQWTGGQASIPASAQNHKNALDNLKAKALP